MSTYKVINSKSKEINTDVLIHPGEIIEMELDARDLKKSEFAASLGMRPGHFSELLHGKRHIGAYLALRLEKMLGISAEYWMRVQVYYDLFKEREKHPEMVQ